MSENEKNYLIETMTIDLAKMVMQDFKMDMAASLDAVYNSMLFEKMCNPETHLMFQSPVYVYCYLEQELRTGVMG